MELMTALNRLHGGKNIKLPYFIAQLSRYAVPKVLLRSRLEEILRDGEKRYDMDYVLDRVNYYNRLTGAERLSPTEATPLKEHKFRGRHSAYIFDSYQTTRFFDDSLRWQTYFGDGVFDLLHPTIIKARKIDRGGRSRFRQRRYLRIAQLGPLPLRYPAARQNSVYGESRPGDFPGIG